VLPCHLWVAGLDGYFLVGAFIREREISTAAGSFGNVIHTLVDPSCARHQLIDNKNLILKIHQ
ncbi:MAG: hypothetical protein AAFQ57_14295, partial [Cyanobacteria bacterium J06626_14]